MKPETQQLLDDADGNVMLALASAVADLAAATKAPQQALPPGAEVLVWYMLTEQKPDVGVTVLTRRSGGTLDLARLHEDGKFYTRTGDWPIDVVMWAAPKGPGP